MASQSGSSEHSRRRSPPTRSSETPQDDMEIKKARKREQDRLCQRRKREKDRENLRRLEARLNGLQNPDEPKVVLDLILRHEQDQEKLSRQADRLRQIESLIRTSLQDMGGDSSSTPTEGPSDTKIESKEVNQPASSASVAGLSPQTYPTAQSTPMPTTTTPACTLPIHSTAMPTPQYTPDFTSSMPQSQPMMQPSPVSMPSTPSGITLLTEAIAQVPNFGTAGLALPDDTMDQHLIVMIILHGWDAVGAYFHLDPLWALLRQIDGSSSAHWRRVDRMVGMLSIRRMMKGFVMGAQAMAQLEPKFLRPRPSQLHITHVANGDYFPWPGVRERFVFESHKYLHDTFLSIFNSNTRFLWPLDFEHTFTQSTNRQLFQFSDELMKRFNNLNCWAVDAAFIAAYPEFAGDIPTYNSVPPRIEEKGFEGYWFEKEGQEDQQQQGSASAQAQWVLDDRRWFASNGVR